MGKPRSIQSQLRYVIEQSISFGRSKHNDRINGVDTESKLYSYSNTNNMVDTAKDFATYMKENHKDIKQVSQIKAEHIQGYLDTKALTCNQNTLDQLYSRLGKLETMANKVYKHSDINFEMSAVNKNVATRTTKMRDVAMTEKDYQEIINTDKPSDWKRATQLSHEFGLRVSESCKLKVQDIKENSIYIYQSKGGRSREIKIETAEQRALVTELKEYAKQKGFADNETIIKAKPDSVNKGLRERSQKLGLTKYTEAKTGMHAVRKNYCIREYDKELEKWEAANEKWDKSKINMEAWDKVSHKIGHGDGRTDLAHSYLCK